MNNLNRSHLPAIPGLFLIATIGLAQPLRAQEIPPTTDGALAPNPPAKWLEQQEVGEAVATDVQRDDLVLQQVRLDNVMQPKSETDIFIDCTKNTVCKAALDAAAAYVGVDSSYVTSAVAEFAQQRAGEETRTTMQFPTGYEYCRVRVEVTSVVPYEGDRASLLSVTGAENSVDAYTWTPIRGYGNGRSWVDANIMMLGVRKELAAEYQAKGICTTAMISATCRGNGQNKHGQVACGVMGDSMPARR